MPVINGAKPVDYQFQEYPKWVTLPDGSQKIVEDSHEEHTALGTKPKEDEIEPEFVGFKGFEFKLDAPIKDDAPSDIVPQEPIFADEDMNNRINIVNIDSLRKQADELGLIYDKRWGETRLRQAIDNARKSA